LTNLYHSAASFKRPKVRSYAQNQWCLGHAL
jgi:hypothetical protein